MRKPKLWLFVSLVISTSIAVLLVYVLPHVFLGTR
jgi:hypothetical protein